MAEHLSDRQGLGHEHRCLVGDADAREVALEIEAGRVIDLLNALYERYPALAGRLDHAAVAIDGDIYNDARFQPLAPDSEVHFMGQISGGR